MFEITIDQSKLTGRDLLAIEKEVGRPVARYFQGGGEGLPMDVLYALLLVLKRKDDPTVTMDTLLDLPMDDMEIVQAPPPDPTSGVA